MRLQQTSHDRGVAVCGNWPVVARPLSVYRCLETCSDVSCPTVESADSVWSTLCWQTFCHELFPQSSPAISSGPQRTWHNGCSSYLCDSWLILSFSFLWCRLKARTERRY